MRLRDPTSNATGDRFAAAVRALSNDLAGSIVERERLAKSVKFLGALETLLGPDHFACLSRETDRILSAGFASMTATTRRSSLAGLSALSALLLTWYLWPRNVAESGHVPAPGSPAGVHSSERPVAVSFGTAANAIPADVGVSLNVLVTDDAGRPIAGALVCAQPFSEAVALASAASCRRSTGDGSASWSPAPAEVNRVVASAPGYAAKEKQVHGSEVVTIALERAASAVSGQIEDSSGGPVIGALVTVFADADGETVLGASLSDAEGAFVVPARPGPSRLRVVADGYASWQRDVMAPSSGVRVVMAMGSAIVGHVTEAASRRPLAGVVVQATRNDVATGSFGRAMTSFDGELAIRNLGPGTHFVQVVGEEWAATSHEVQLALGAPAVVDFAATRAGRVEVTLTVGGKPCLRGGLVLHGPSPGAGVVEEGGLVRVSGLKPGDYTACPTAPTPGRPCRSC